MDTFYLIMMWFLTIVFWMLAAGFLFSTLLFGGALIREIYGIFKERHMRNREWKEHDWSSVMMYGIITFVSMIFMAGLVFLALMMSRNL